jgi:hypothetical protein
MGRLTGRDVESSTDASEEQVQRSFDSNIQFHGDLDLDSRDSDGSGLRSAVD